ncbi:hypothetical protein [Dickeya dadantii]|uniref:hypothetical protein n=1 Tax=Dickeya dadantii TaxID=204038 RepID=UPI00126944C8|nr:hypothetical protein [Dickeya dadantii]
MKKQSQDTFLALLFLAVPRRFLLFWILLKKLCRRYLPDSGANSAIAYPVSDAEQLSRPDRKPRGEIPRGMPSLKVGPVCFDAALTSITYLIKIISIAAQHQDHIHTPR